VPDSASFDRSATGFEALAETLRQSLPAERLISDPLRRLAYGTDASFYRLIPGLIVVVESEAEVMALLAACRRHRLPITFRAAGTSLSGQAVTSSVLVVLGDGWNAIEVAADGASVRLGPGVIGSDANACLKAFGRKIGPDPASINACKIGGIAANNASGMCCGTAQNSYRTLKAMRVILADGTLLDTADPASREAFARSHHTLIAALSRLAEETKGNADLAERIRRKFSIKNTCGYSLNALIDFSDPIDILAHLMIGSEGTLGFIAEITYQTVPEHAHKASALALFASVVEAAEAVMRLKTTPVAAVELMDRASLRSVEDKPGMPEGLRGLPEGATALLIETRAADGESLAANVTTVSAALAGVRTLAPLTFTDEPEEFERLWNIRKGLFPSVGAMRQTGTTVIIEDVAFPIERLADAVADLQRLFAEHGYENAILFGHALAGNLHFVFTPDLGKATEVERYARFMDAVCHLVVEGYDGSLKAEHGTGRNMAPFVELEWGRDAYRLMHAIKALFDPEGLLNPGVILNDDPAIHLKNLKPLPAADALVDQCMECGFCERMCPSAGLTLTPRQRIVGWREISRLRAEGETASRETLVDLYAYQGLDTCAACGLCATACPVGIETGLLTKKLRGSAHGDFARSVAGIAGDYFGMALAATREGLRLADWAARLVGDDRLARVTQRLRRVSGGRIPPWTPVLPKPAPRVTVPAFVGAPGRPAVVYLPSCVSRAMGPAHNDGDGGAVSERLIALMHKAGYRVILPRALSGLCCGQPFESKGFEDVADRKSAEVALALAEASLDGELPIVCDTSPCSYRLKRSLPSHLRPLDTVEFIHDHLMDKLVFTRQAGAIALHITCSAQKMGLKAKFMAVANACAEEVVAPAEAGCCGWAGDKGWTTPELNAHALRQLKAVLPPGCRQGYSNSRTCEIGLAQHAGIPYRSIAELVDACTEPKPVALRT
jgi:D-lactate dehydrogenase